jgi:hypothetical protein
MATVKRTNMIVSLFFLSNIHDRILKQAEEQAEWDLPAKADKKLFAFASMTAQLTISWASTIATDAVQSYNLKPIANLFPHTTVMVSSAVLFALL